MCSGSSGCATTTGEVWSETWRERRFGSEIPRRKDFLRLFLLYNRRVSWEKRLLLGEQSFVLRTLALLRPDTQPRAFAGILNEAFLKAMLQGYSDMLRESVSGVPHPPPRDSLWVDFMMAAGISDDELELAKNIYAYSQRTCAFCGSNAAPLRKCSL